MAAFAISDLPQRKIIGAVAVVVLHILALAALMRATLLPAPVVRPPYESILWFILPAKPKPHIVEEKELPVMMTPSPDGARLSTYSEEQSQQLEAVRKIMKRRRHVLRELAK